MTDTLSEHTIVPHIWADEALESNVADLQRRYPEAAVEGFQFPLLKGEVLVVAKVTGAALDERKALKAARARIMHNIESIESVMSIPGCSSDKLADYHRQLASQHDLLAPIQAKLEEMAREQMRAAKAEGGFNLPEDDD